MPCRKLLGQKEHSTDTLQLMQTWLQANIVRTLTTLKNLKSNVSAYKEKKKKTFKRP